MKSYAVVSNILHTVLIEIRATDSLKKAQILADVMHNVPIMMGHGRPEPGIISEIVNKAKRQGADRYFAKLIEDAERRFTE